MSVTNILIILNLGCEMLYVIDQRLKAQSIPLDKSAQVLREITEVLLDPKFLHYISTAYQQSMLTVQQTRILLTDIACCSLMRLDVSSMDKLWDLMVMIFKWQMFLTNKNAQMLLDLTFRHLDGIGRLIPEMRKQILIDNVKKTLIELWEPLCEDEQIIVHRKVCKWLKPYNTKISILIRMGLQKSNGEFEPEPKNNIFYNYYINNIGENVYSKTANLTALRTTSELNNSPGNSGTDMITAGHEIDTLVQQLNIHHDPTSTSINPIQSTQVSQSSSLHGALNEIVIAEGNNHSESSHSSVETQKYKHTSNDDESLCLGNVQNIPQESNLTKLMKKINLDKEDFKAVEEDTTDTNEQLLQMFDQK
ncbi:protein OSCP1 [Anopheles ziemanni]|uniref:protein OSCP1 n=1 Tax=Anopheles coustani TaxID=139045 RepID=UPI002658D253|nr:protein OSCP1 [Anopheles coustani]XP_058170780.1 protein OSCP1 [Anopheles ziemanni]